MKTFAPINIIVHYPETKEGWRELRRRVAGVHADGVLNSISKLDCPIREKERLLNAITGENPALNGKERHTAY